MRDKSATDLIEGYARCKKKYVEQINSTDTFSAVNSIPKSIWVERQVLKNFNFCEENHFFFHQACNVVAYEKA